jgi:hypothetical protein
MGELLLRQYFVWIIEEGFHRGSSINRVALNYFLISINLYNCDVHFVMIFLLRSPGVIKRFCGGRLSES